MADMDDISAILGLLASGGEENKDADAGSSDSAGSIFGEIDPEMLIRLISVFSQLGEHDKNTDLLLALKPHLKAENRPKVDSALQLMKLITIMGALSDNNFLK